MAENREEPLSWEEFTRVELRAGTVVSARPFPEARRPAWRLEVDLGPLGVKASSAQLTALYAPEDLVGTQVLCVCNLAPKRIGPVRSEVLVTGFVLDETPKVVLARPDRPVPPGTRLL